MHGEGSGRPHGGHVSGRTIVPRAYRTRLAVASAWRSTARHGELMVSAGGTTLAQPSRVAPGLPSCEAFRVRAGSSFDSRQRSGLDRRSPGPAGSTASAFPLNDGSQRAWARFEDVLWTLSRVITASRRTELNGTESADVTAGRAACSVAVAGRLSAAHARNSPPAAATRVRDALSCSRSPPGLAACRHLKLL